jgi:hypothetical protein
LAVDHNILKFVFEHPSTIQVATAIVQLVRAIVEKRNVKVDKKNPPAVIIANDKSLKIPASPQTEKKFVDDLKSPKPRVADKKPSKKTAKKAKTTLTPSGKRTKNKK